MKTISLNGKWKCKPDHDNLGIKSKWYSPISYAISSDNLLDIEIPQSFNLIRGFENFEGVFWHFFEFDLEETINTIAFDYVLRFKGSNYNTKVWLNGLFIGEHDGGFTPFQFNINELIQQNNNILVVRTDSTRRLDQIPSISFDWFNWGGIYRDIDLLVLNKDRIEDVQIKTHLITRDKSRLEVLYKKIGNPSVHWEILDINNEDLLFTGTLSEPDKQNSIVIILNNPKLWSPEQPNLYYLKFYNYNPNGVREILYETHFGIRQIDIQGIALYLNKRRIILKGVSLHEEYMPYGRTIPYEKRKEDVENIKSLGFNALRTAHYSHDEDLLNIADRIGLLILEEIPVYQHCSFKNTKTYSIAENMLKELIKRDINHPSVIWWSVGNETPLHQWRTAKFTKKLMNFARGLDDTRIVTCVSRKLLPDLTRKYVDIATINTYFGWYYGHENMIGFILDLIRTPVFNKPWIYTEFGAGAKYGFHEDWKKQVKYSEERQLQILDHTIKTINSKDYFSGWFIWIYRDFKSTKRINKFQQGYNRKGIVSGEANEKKLIYYRLPKILNEKKKTIGTRILGIILWIILFPLSYFIITRFLDSFIAYIEKRESYIHQ
ncbi:MAG: glycoside hydrolase family 2 protein [Candidatus Hermodarchaeota archaeon]